MSLSPILLIIYNRPSLTLQTLEVIEQNLLAQSSILYVYADGPKLGATKADKQKIADARKVVRQKQWCKEVIIIEREENLGLAKSIISGVTEIVNKHKKVIVVEDDLNLSPYFLQYMNDALDIYENNTKVLSIGACNFYSSDNKTPETFFLPIPDCLGWATWANRWALFEADSNKLYKQLEESNLLDAFNVYGAYDFLNMLKMQADGKISSWAIRWQAVAYIHDKFTLYPKYSLSNHIGNDFDATHSKDVDYSTFIQFPTRPINVQRINPHLSKHVFRSVINRYTQMSGQQPSLPWQMLSYKELITRACHLKYVRFPSSPIVVRRERVKVESVIFDTILQTYKEMYGSSEPKKNMDLRYVLKKLTPPVVLDLFRYLKRPSESTETTLGQDRIDTAKAGHLYWEGNYGTWQEALTKSDGYDAPLILNQVKEAVLKVKNGEAVYERDSVLFEKIQYSWPLLAILLKIASENDGRLSVLDFGGSLGSSYFQNRSFLSGLKHLEWSIVEQESFVACGKESVAGEVLQFFYTIEDCLKYRTPDVLLLSGVLQCLDAPYQWLEQFLGHSFPNLVLDRTAFIGTPDRLTVQHVPESIYEASYPAWFLNQEKVIAAISTKYDFVADFDNGFSPPYTLEDGALGCWNGLFFTLKK